MLFIKEVVVWMLFTYCNFKFSVFISNFIKISACSSLSTSFRKSISGSRIEDGCDALFLLFFLIEVLVSSLRLLSSLCFYYHAY